MPHGLAEVRRVDLAQRALVHPHVDDEPRVLDAVGREVLRIGEDVLLHAADERGSHAAEMHRVLAVRLLGASPARMAEDVDGRRQQHAPRLCAHLGAHRLPHLLLEVGIPRGAARGADRECGGMAGVLAHAARAVDHRESRDAQPVERRRTPRPLHQRGAVHLLELLVDRHLAEELVDALLDDGAGVAADADVGVLRRHDGIGARRGGTEETACEIVPACGIARRTDRPARQSGGAARDGDRARGLRLQGGVALHDPGRVTAGAAHRELVAVGPALAPLEASLTDRHGAAELLERLRLAAAARSGERVRRPRSPARPGWPPRPRGSPACTPRAPPRSVRRRSRPPDAEPPPRRRCMRAGCGAPAREPPGRASAASAGGRDRWCPPGARRARSRGGTMRGSSASGRAGSGQRRQPPPGSAAADRHAPTPAGR